MSSLSIYAVYFICAGPLRKGPLLCVSPKSFRLVTMPQLHPFSQVSHLLSQNALLYVSLFTDPHVSLLLPVLGLTHTESWPKAFSVKHRTDGKPSFLMAAALPAVIVTCEVAPSSSLWAVDSCCI